MVLTSQQNLVLGYGNGCLSVRRIVERLHRYEEEVTRNESTY